MAARHACSARRRPRSRGSADDRQIADYGRRTRTGRDPYRRGSRRDTYAQIGAGWRSGGAQRLDELALVQLVGAFDVELTGAAEQLGLGPLLVGGAGAGAIAGSVDVLDGVDRRVEQLGGLARGRPATRRPWARAWPVTWRAPPRADDTTSSAAARAWPLTVRPEMRAASSTVRVDVATAVTTAAVWS